jgi:hypothetical protein
MISCLYSGEEEKLSFLLGLDDGPVTFRCGVAGGQVTSESSARLLRLSLLLPFGPVYNIIPPLKEKVGLFEKKYKFP